MKGAFLKGYKAFVNGGRRRIHIKGPDYKYYDGYEPFDHMTDEQKAEWLAGVEEGKRERAECRLLLKQEQNDKKYSTNGVRHNSKGFRAKLDELTPKVIELLWTTMSKNDIARTVGLSRTFVDNTIKRANDHKLVEWRNKVAIRKQKK